MEEAMAKLVRGPVPVKVPRYPYQVQALKEELARYEKAGKIRLTRFAFWRKTPGPIEHQARLLRAKIEALEKEHLDGFLCPITEAEMWECRAKYAALRLQVRRAFKWDVAEQLKQDQETAVDLVCDSAFVARQVLCSLKHKSGDGWERVLNEDDLPQIDPRVLTGLFQAYAAAFILTDDEKKN